MAGDSPGGAGQGGSAGRGGPQRCTDARPLVPGQATGFFRCGPDSSFIHRAARADCASQVPREDHVLPPSRDPAEGGAGGAGGNSGARECTTDYECSEKPLGFCSASNNPFGPFANMCRYGCQRDEQCATGELCLCGDPVGECVPASCGLDANCAEGALCASYDIVDECKIWQNYGFACQDMRDECAGSDCDGYCTKTGDHRVCDPGASGCGRPFLIDGKHRQAAPTRRLDWAQRHVFVACDGLSSEARQRIGREWLESALLEHASIASFARFTLQLLEFGAPAELVEASGQAMLEEAGHARICFAIAGQYLDEPVGPTALSLAGALPSTSLLELCRLTLLEGCIGESVAAAIASELSSRARDSVLRDVLNGIAGEELSHAALAFRFLHWAVPRLSAEDHARLVAHFRRAVKDLVQGTRQRVFADTGVHGELLLEHGVMSESIRAEVVEAALADMIEPCAARILRAPSARPRTRRAQA